VAAAAIVNHTHEIRRPCRADVRPAQPRSATSPAYGHDSPAIRERLAEAEIPSTSQLALLTAKPRATRIRKLGSIIRKRGQSPTACPSRLAGDPRDISGCWIAIRCAISAEISSREGPMKARTSEANACRPQRRGDLGGMVLQLRCWVRGTVAALQ
jgi:hypothetical protein